MRKILVARIIQVENMHLSKGPYANTYKVLRPATGKELVDFLARIDSDEPARWLMSDDGKIYVWDGAWQIHSRAITDLGLEDSIGGYMSVQNSQGKPAALYINWYQHKHMNWHEEMHGNRRHSDGYNPVTQPSFAKLLSTVPIPIERATSMSGMGTPTRQELNQLQPDFADA